MKNFPAIACHLPSSSIDAASSRIGKKIPPNPASIDSFTIPPTFPLLSPQHPRLILREQTQRTRSDYSNNPELMQRCSQHWPHAAGGCASSPNRHQRGGSSSLHLHCPSILCLSPHSYFLLKNNKRRKQNEEFVLFDQQLRSTPLFPSILARLLHLIIFAESIYHYFLASALFGLIVVFPEVLSLFFEYIDSTRTETKTKEEMVLADQFEQATVSHFPFLFSTTTNWSTKCWTLNFPKRAQKSSLLSSTSSKTFRSIWTKWIKTALLRISLDSDTLSRKSFSRSTGTTDWKKHQLVWVEEHFCSFLVRHGISQPLPQQRKKWEGFEKIILCWLESHGFVVVHEVQISEFNWWRK